MSVQVSGQGGSGTVTVYTLADNQSAVLETLSFTVTTDATAGVHAVRVKLELPTVGVIARLDDLNEGAPSQTNFYSYGLGLNGSACTLPNGIAVTDALPWTELPSAATVTLEAINAAGAVIAGDTFSDVFLQFDRGVTVLRTPPPLPLTLLPGSAAA